MRRAARAARPAPVRAISTWKPGQRSREELLAAFPEAVLVIELIGQGVNGVTGDYSRGAVGFMVRGGEIAEPVAEMTIAANLIDMFATPSRARTSNSATGSTRRPSSSPK